MLKSITLLALGAVFGGIAAIVLSAGADDAASPDSSSRSLLATVAELARGRSRQPAEQTVSVTETLSLYRTLASESDVENLQAALEAVAAEAWSPANDTEIAALLARLSDLDPALSAAQAQTLGLGAHFVADAYVNWSRADPEAAIAALRSLGGRALRLDVALAMLDVFGDDASGINRVGAGLTEAERTELSVEAIVSRAEYEPYAAFRDAQLLSSADLQRRALRRIGAAWAAQDPRSAIAQAGQLPVDLQSMYRIGVIDEWARLDGADFLAWLATTPSPPTEATAGVARLAGTSQVDLVMRVADSLPGELGRNLRSSALMALGQTDPAAAMAMAGSLPPGPEREALLMSVGFAVARTDPDAAMAWARELTPPSPNVLRQVAMAIIQNDPGRAIELMENPPEGIDPTMISAMIGSSVRQDSDGAEALASRLVASDSIQATNALRNVVGSWIQQDPERALEWVLANDAALDAAIIGPAAQAIARTDPLLAASYLNRIPSEYRAAWVMQVAGPYGLQDPDGALAWVAQFQGQDIHDDALRQIVVASAQSDPRAAARLLSQSSEEVQLGAATQVAQALARQDPREAAQWATSLTEPRAQQGALGASMAAWAGQDLSAAQRFALSLERGDTRDQALSALLASMSQAGRFDRGLLDAYSSDSQREQVLERTIPVIARTDREGAEDLLGLVTSANTRRLIEQRIDALN